MPQPALLLVLSEPGNGVPEDAFQDWYDNEHIPLRIATPAFSSWVRLNAIDGEKPQYGAIYDLSSFEDTRRAPYTTLAETRSDREKEMFAKARIFDRRIYELHDKYSIHPPSALFDPKKAAPITVIRGLDAKEGAEEELSAWYNEEHIPMLSKCPEWIRSRWFVLKESGYMGAEAEQYKKPPPKFMAVHEWSALGFEDRPEYKAALSTPWKDKAVKGVVGTERRVFKLMRQWEK